MLQITDYQKEAIETLRGDIMFDEDDHQYQETTFINGVMCCRDFEKVWVMAPIGYELYAEVDPDGTVTLYKKEFFDKGYEIDTALYEIDIQGEIFQL